MKGFKIITAQQNEIRFAFYELEAPVTSAAFAALLPITRTFYHARVSGQEIWIDDAPPLNIKQENATVFTEPGEVVFGPEYPKRVKTTNCLGIYYGEGKGLDACNVFAKVIEADKEQLLALGNEIWKSGAQPLTLLAWDGIMHEEK